MESTTLRSEPCKENQFALEIADLLCLSFKGLTGKPLLTSGADLGQRLYEAPFAVLAHDTQPDPIFFYANLAAQKVFEITWGEIVTLPSRVSAEALNQTERARLLEEVKRYGFISNYSGVRISKTGRRFLVQNATVWNLTNNDGVYCGQAATFAV